MWRACLRAPAQSQRSPRGQSLLCGMPWVLPGCPTLAKLPRRCTPTPRDCFISLAAHVVPRAMVTM